MRKVFAVLAGIIFLLTGCGVPYTDGLPVPEPSQSRAIDCDLIFPGPSANSLMP